MARALASLAAAGAIVGWAAAAGAQVPSVTIGTYKERGVWKPGMDQVQQKLLATRP